MTVMNVLSPTQATQTPTQASMPALVRDVAGQPNQDKRKRLAALLRQRMSGLPLSHGQRAMWFIHQLAPSCVAYNEVFAWHIRTAVKEGILQQALRALQMQHATLRTAYVMHEGKPIANILAEAPFDFEVVESVDWSEVQLEEAMVRVSHQPFCLERGEIIRARLFRRPNAESVLLIVAHHIAIDFWSVHLLAQDLKAFYASLCNGQGVALRPTEARYDEFVAWQTEYLQANEVRLWAYWQRNLGGTLPTLNLPNDKPRPMVQQFAGASHVLRVPEQIYQGLRNLAKAEATTLYTLVLSAYALLLRQLTQQTDVLIGTPMAGRAKLEFDNTVGLFVNTLPIRIAFPAGASCRQLVQHIRQSVVEAVDHQEYPVSLMVERLQPQRDPAYPLLFQTVFAWEDAAQLAAAPPRTAHAPANTHELLMQSLHLTQQVSKMDLSVLAVDTHAEMSIILQYNTALFAPGTVQRWGETFVALLQHLITNLDAPVASLSCVADEVTQQIRNQWNHTQADCANDVHFHHLFEQRTLATPHNIAIQFQSDQTSLLAYSYVEVNQRANRLACYLRQLGVGPEVMAAVYLDRSPDVVVAFLAILKAGGAYLPLDTAHPPERTTMMLEDAQPIVVITTYDLLMNRLPNTNAKVLCLDLEEPTMALLAEANPGWPIHAQHPAYAIYTSGSTGKPKGCLITHAGLSNLCQAQRDDIDLPPAARVLQFSSLSFDASIFEMALAFGVGGTLHMAPRENLMPGPGLTHTLREQAIQAVVFPPSVLALLPESELPQLSTIMVAGEACSADLVAHWAPGRRFLNLYGPTETTIWATLSECVLGKDAPSIGSPIRNLRAYVLDEDFMPVPVGVPGELCIGGTGVSRGYLNRAALTADKFVPDPFGETPGARMYRTGDVACCQVDGLLKFMGRSDQQVKIRGFRVELGEIENELLTHPSVQQTAVLPWGVENSLNPKTYDRLVAYVGVGDAALVTLNDQSLRIHLKKHLPDYMMPARFVILDTLPLTTSGKVDRKALPNPNRSANAHRTSSESSQVPTQITNEMEEILATLWQKALGSTHIGLDDNFFDLGGHSLLMVQIHEQAQILLKREFALVDLFRFPTLRGLAAHLLGNPSRPTEQRDLNERALKQVQAMNAQRRHVVTRSPSGA